MGILSKKNGQAARWGKTSIFFLGLSLSLFLSVAMVLSAPPSIAYAAGDTSGTTTGTDVADGADGTGTAGTADMAGTSDTVSSNGTVLFKLADDLIKKVDPNTPVKILIEGEKNYKASLSDKDSFQALISIPPGEYKVTGIYDGTTGDLLFNANTRFVSTAGKTSSVKVDQSAWSKMGSDLHDQFDNFLRNNIFMGIVLVITLVAYFAFKRRNEITG